MHLQAEIEAIFGALFGAPHRKLIFRWSDWHGRSERR